MDLDSVSRGDIARLTVLARDRVKRKNIMLDSFFRIGKKPPATLVANTRLRGAANEINTIMRRLYMRRKARMDAISLSVVKYGRIARTSGIVLIFIVLITGSGVFWFIIDRIRKQNDLIRRLDASERQLQDAVRIKENFLANMSHEIRTPLNSIIGFTRLLSKKALDAESGEFVSAIKDSGENLLTIINDILDFSKIEAGMMRLDSRPFAVRELFHSVETLFRHRVEEKGLGFLVSVEGDVPELMLGDATRLTQVLVNLISNAAKFTEKGGIEVRVGSAGRDGKTVQMRLEVRDTGIGIGKEQQALIFERFSQAEASTTRKYGGTGLGLAIVKELVALQGGSIDVESEVGKGTTFRCTIPYVLADAAGGLKARSGEEAVRMEGVCVLVADDNRMNQRLMEHLLQGVGMTFDIVDDGAKVIESLKARHYQLVLLDIQMPVLDGYMTSRRIREDLRSSVPIIAMTAHAMRGERERCLEAGMNEYLSKPIDAGELFAMIAKFVPAADASGVGGSTECDPEPATKGDAPTFSIIDLGYLQDLSGGDREYEMEMAEQFLHGVPEELGQLEAALAAGDRGRVSKVAHNLKTTVSIMGLSERLAGLLDRLEYADGDPRVAFDELREVCVAALEEARRVRG
jgi:signal transduction histidine kinase/CheY-like chemotaxis protein/HPt (histidine-containing phosphotransfer) domain-containing protein